MIEEQPLSSDRLDVPLVVYSETGVVVDNGDFENLALKAPHITCTEILEPPMLIPSALPVSIISQPVDKYILIPDLFSSIMSSSIRVNPHYAKVKLKADARIARLMMKDDKWAAKNAKVDLAFLASAWCWTCDEAILNLSMDWNHWVFLFDDRGYPVCSSTMSLEIEMRNG